MTCTRYYHPAQRLARMTCGVPRGAFYRVRYGCLSTALAWRNQAFVRGAVSSCRRNGWLRCIISAVPHRVCSILSRGMLLLLALRRAALYLTLGDIGIRDAAWWRHRLQMAREAGRQSSTAAAPPWLL